MLFLNMLTNAMWFAVTPELKEAGFHYGFIALSYGELTVGFLANFITFPFVFFIVFLFKYSRPNILRENRLLKALLDDDDSEQEDIDDSEEEDENDDEIEEEDNFKDGESSASRPTSNTSTISSNSSITEESIDEEDKFSLPYYFAYFGWLLCFLCIFGSVLFLWAYGITFGNDKTYKWLTSLIVSFLTNFIIFEPLKVI